MQSRWKTINNLPVLPVFQLSSSWGLLGEPVKNADSYHGSTKILVHKILGLNLEISILVNSKVKQTQGPSDHKPNDTRQRPHFSVLIRCHHSSCLHVAFMWHLSTDTVKWEPLMFVISCDFHTQPFAPSSTSWFTYPLYVPPLSRCTQVCKAQVLSSLTLGCTPSRALGNLVL